MCVIAISPKGIKQPSVSDLRSMWDTNPHGAGYMTIRNNRVEIHKGFMHWQDFTRSVKTEAFTDADPVIYHFRIATQGGICPEMTHPFPLTDKLEMMDKLDLACSVGVAHNGIIPITTTTKATDYSDTVLFIVKYLRWLVRSPSDMFIPEIQTMISEIADSKFALMNSNGDIVTIGKFYNHDGILLSNENHLWKDYFMKGEFAKCIAF